MVPKDDRGNRVEVYRLDITFARRPNNCEPVHGAPPLHLLPQSVDDDRYSGVRMGLNDRV